jgi:hypothetical protein
VAENISPELLRALLRYDPETGGLFWRRRERQHFSSGSRCDPAAQARQWNALWQDKPALSTNSSNGYLKGAIFGRTLLAHRVVWAVHFGVWPKQIDHINGVRTDNRIANLREATSQENNRNRSLPSDNKSGRIGVRWHKPDSCWRAHIGVSRRRIHLGSFRKFQDAVAAREEAEALYGFHPNHGRVD